MEIHLEMVASIVFLLSAGLGLGFGLRFFKWMAGLIKHNELKKIINKPFIRLTLWLILGSLFTKPFMDCASLLIESVNIPYMLMQPASERSLPVGWEISYYALYVGVRMLLFGMIYGYAIWMVPKIISMVALEKGIIIHSRGFEGICITFTSGSLLHALITSIAFNIEHLSIPALLGNNDSTAGYFIGWLIALMTILVVLYGLNKIISRKIKPAPILGTNLT